MEEKTLNAPAAPSNFIHDFIDADLESGAYDHVQTRFPPEPNGYLHIGHAKAIYINFYTSEKYNGICNLRMDDTNPGKEDTEYADAIAEDIKWLGYNYANLYHASDYFDYMYEKAILLIKKGLAYVDDLSADEIREYRGTLTEPGKNSPYRERSIEENLDLFDRMTKGEFADGEKVLRAKIDMASPNMNMRDPVIYRIAHMSHFRQGDKWCVYPMYDFAHPLEDACEGVTHSLCSLEFENHRPLYDWVCRECEVDKPAPRQIEFARLNLNYCVTSKRRCLYLVNNGYVDGWDDPRMVTISGMRRRGFPPAAIRDFCARIGISKAYSVVDFGLLEACVRDDLNENAPRAMAVLRPLKVIIDNYPEGQTEEIEVEVHPKKPEMGTRKVTFSRELFIEQDDFMIEPAKKYRRFYPGNEVRLKGAYYATCTSFETDDDGNVTCIHVEYDPESKGGETPDGRKVKGTIHWVNAADCIPAEVRLYDRLFNVPNPSDPAEPLENYLNPNSLEVLAGAVIEGGLVDLKPGDTFQFMRKGYYTVDKYSTEDKLIFNRTVDLNSSWK
ncbi:MAG: glutamine--tRNA ligase/YqeY domain fusion protein [Clostridia bacterium]|nr:glutamine--tRNA ligase/YqeY domain fusion protein [Clostridia bacterium]MBQ6525038.1 glutamine--tRNA ligase/YqeY domain fusion protein [Clostridia bacterium]